MTDMKKLANFCYETGQLKRVKRSGWWLINVKDPESVAEHSFRTAVMGFFLAKLEGADPHKVASMSLFNDIHETRLNDLHKVGHRYIDFKEAESKAHSEQLQTLGDAGKELLDFMSEFQARESLEANVARDADLLECAVEARELIKIGFEDAQNWIDNIKTLLKTESAKKLLTELENTDPNDWWRDLKKCDR